VTGVYVTLRCQHPYGTADPQCAPTTGQHRHTSALSQLPYNDRHCHGM